MKNKYLLENIKRLLNSKLFSTLSFLLIIMIFIQVWGYSKVGVYNSAIAVFTNPLFLVLCYFPVFIFLTQYNFQLFDKDVFLIIRLKSKRKYLIELLKNVVVTNSIIFIICLIILFICQNFLNGLDYKIENVDVFHTTNLFYMIYTFFKLYAITILLSIMLTLLFKKFNKNIVFVISFIFLGFVYMAGYNIYYINSISNFRFLLSDVLVNNIEFSSFYLNIIHSSVIAILLLIVDLILYRFVIKRMKEIGN